MQTECFTQYPKSKSTSFATTVVVFTLFFVPLSLFAATSNVPKTGQTVSYASGDDGALKKGVAWPNPRFKVSSSSGTVKDNLTGLVWLRNANCFPMTTWGSFLSNAATIKDGVCGLHDGSALGAWRVPNIRELESLIHSGFTSPAVPNTVGDGNAAAGNPFNSLQIGDYFSSTTITASPTNVFAVKLHHGTALSKLKNSVGYGIFVRDSTSSTPATAAVYKTGQTQCYDNSGGSTSCAATGQDGELKKGLAWPEPRFSDLGDGTIYDNLTNLTWLKKANCFSTGNWLTGLNNSKGLSSGNCGLSDSSKSGDWRLPNRKELMSLLAYGFNTPAVSNTTGTGKWTNNSPFTGIQTSADYWTSTTYAATTINGWFSNVKSGTIDKKSKGTFGYAWPVRGTLLSSTSVSLLGDGKGKVTSSPSGISCPGTCSASFDKFSSVYLTAKADKGSQFVGWSIGSCGKNPTCHVYMANAEQKVTATFVEYSGKATPWLLLLKE